VKKSTVSRKMYMFFLYSFWMKIQTQFEVFLV
jgi:hypothetical protein